MNFLNDIDIKKESKPLLFNTFLDSKTRTVGLIDDSIFSDKININAKLINSKSISNLKAVTNNQKDFLSSFCMKNNSNDSNTGKDQLASEMLDNDKKMILVVSLFNEMIKKQIIKVNNTMLTSSDCIYVK